MVTTILMSVFGALALVLVLSGLVARGARGRLWPAAIMSAAAALAARGDAFWVMVGFGLVCLFLVIVALPIGDGRFRSRFAMVNVIGVLAFLMLWPTLDVLTSGKLPCPRFIEDRVGARLIAGLDLRGGLRLVYTVDVAEAVKDKRDNYYEDMRKELAKLYAGYTGDEVPAEEVFEKLREKVELTAPRRPSNLVRLKIKEGFDPAKIDARFRDLFKPDLETLKVGDREFEFSIREATETNIRERAVAQAKDIILRRVDAMGLREAVVSTRDEDIIVEVPGDNEAIFNEIREIISQTARLEFKLLDDESNYFSELERTGSKESQPEGLEFRRETVPVGLDASGEAAQAVGTYAYLPFLQGEKAAQALVRLKSWIATLEPPADREIGYEIDYRVVDQNSLKEEEAGFRTYLVRSRTEITGDMVRDAAAQPNQSTQSLGGWYVTIAFTDQGGRIFERITGANVKRRFAIILDGRVESAPQIIDKISGGSAQITMGSGDPQIQLKDSRKLELVLRSGALPAPISPSNEQLIGPSLGQEAIKLGVQGAAGGGLLVLVFMLIYYRVGGLIADVSVLMNLFLQLAILASFGASMTLPGIAGLALTLGMGVDANILINERIREELREGKNARTAVEIGYNKAFSAIIDGQLTTFIAGLVLAQYGTGPIKGFAVTLMVGVVISIFTGVVVSRVLFDIWLLLAGKNSSKSLV